MGEIKVYILVTGNHSFPVWLFYIVLDIFTHTVTDNTGH